MTSWSERREASEKRLVLPGVEYQPVRPVESGYEHRKYPFCCARHLATGDAWAPCAHDW